MITYTFILGITAGIGIVFMIVFGFAFYFYKKAIKEAHKEHLSIKHGQRYYDD